MTGKVHRSRTVRAVYIGLGFLCLGVAVIGVFLPLIPTTGPVLLAGFFFARSSERFNTWLLSHPRFGPLVRDYHAGLGIPRRAKVLAVAMIGATFTLSIVFVVESPAWRAILAGLAVGIVAFILTRPTRHPEGVVTADAVSG